MIRGALRCPTVTCMPSRYARNTVPLIRDRSVCRARHDRPRRTMMASPDTYFGRVAIDREVARANFSRFIQSTLDAARARGLNQTAIEELTGVGTSTFHRWRRGDWGHEWPKIQQVIDFCKGLGIPEEDAFAALGLRSERTATPPAPMDPEIVRVLRMLADPNVPRAQKDALRLMLRTLAAIPTEQPKPSTRPIRRRKGA